MEQAAKYQIRLRLSTIKPQMPSHHHQLGLHLGLLILSGLPIENLLCASQ
jgi:hypothetical protein